MERRSGALVLVVQGSLARAELNGNCSNCCEPSTSVGTLPATLDFPEHANELLTVLTSAFAPTQPLTWPTGAMAEITAAASKAAEAAWTKVAIPWSDFDAVHLSVCKERSKSFHDSNPDDGALPRMNRRVGFTKTCFTGGLTDAQSDRCG